MKKFRISRLIPGRAKKFSRRFCTSRIACQFPCINHRRWKFPRFRCVFLPVGLGNGTFHLVNKQRDSCLFEKKTETRKSIENIARKIWETRKVKCRGTWCVQKGSVGVCASTHVITNFPAFDTAANKMHAKLKKSAFHVTPQSVLL